MLSLQNPPNAPKSWARVFDNLKTTKLLPNHCSFGEAFEWSQNVRCQSSPTGPKTLRSRDDSCERDRKRPECLEKCHLDPVQNGGDTLLRTFLHQTSKCQCGKNLKTLAEFEKKIVWTTSTPLRKKPYV